MFTEKVCLTLFMVAYTRDEALSGKFGSYLFTSMETDHCNLVKKLQKPVLAQIFVIFQTMGHITILKTTIRAASVALCIIENAVVTYTTVSLRSAKTTHQKFSPAKTNKQMWIFWRNVKSCVTRTLDVRDTLYIMCHKTGFASVSSQQTRPVTDLELCFNMNMLMKMPIP